jgi:hypothetical protein
MSITSAYTCSLGEWPAPERVAHPIEGFILLFDWMTAVLFQKPSHEITGHEWAAVLDKAWHLAWRHYRQNG